MLGRDRGDLAVCFVLRNTACTSPCSWAGGAQDYRPSAAGLVGSGHTAPVWIENAVGASLHGVAVEMGVPGRGDWVEGVHASRVVGLEIGDFSVQQGPSQHGLYTSLRPSLE
jgi:hypothetical protein